MKNVLIVEDDPMVAQINKNYVESVEGFKVIGIATNGGNAMEFFKKNRIDLIILDIYMSKVDGISLLKEIRQKNMMCDVIMVTAAKESDKIDDALKLGVIDYLIKPFEYERLKKSLENYLNRYNLFKKKGSMKQEDIDKITMGTISLSGDNLPKGLNKMTLDRVTRYLEANRNKLLSSEEISDRLGVTKVTVRRYMDYLEKIGLIKQEIEYGSIGRPSYKYRCMK